MKTERRHDLETNSLAVRLARWIESIKPYTGQLLVVVLVLVVVSALSSMWGNYSSAQQRAAWDAYVLANQSTDPELMSMQRLAEDEEYAGTPTQEWAYLVWANRQVLLAERSYLIDHEGTKDRLRRVEGVFDELSSNASIRQLRDRARFGLARVYELQNKLDKAREEYAKVQGDLQPLAAARLEQLYAPDAQTVNDWLANAEVPKPAARGRAAGLRPGFETTLPDAEPGGEATTARSLEELLGDFSSDSDDEDRYGEDPADAPTIDGATSGESAAEADDQAPAEQ